jgi:Site-specific recombinase XerD
MASIRKKTGSKYWFACFTLPNGRRVQQSTKLTDKKRAQKVADEWEAAFRDKVAARQSQRVIASLHKELTGSSLPRRSVRSYFDSWLAAKKGDIGKGTEIFYRTVIDAFLAFLGGRAEMDLSEIEADEILAFRQTTAERVSATTTNHYLKTLRGIFEQARRDGCLADNPAAGVKLMKRDSARSSRRSFTLPELKAVIASCDDEWKSLVLFGLYTGQRLGDLAMLTWSNIDLAAGEIRLVTRKTGRTQIIPLASPLRSHVEELPAGDDPNAPIHPIAFETVTRTGKTSMLSAAFYSVMQSAGLVPPRTHKKKSDPNAGRATSQLSFHSLRHTATSLMKQAGIGAAVVQDLIGHESAAVSQNYTHIADEAKREALNKLPDLR